MPPAVPVVRPPSIEKEPAFLAFASGLAIGASSENLEARSEAINFILGQSQQHERKCLSSAVKHLVLCGGTFPEESVLRETGVKEVDSVLARVAATVPTDIMPGRCEPTNLSLPQRPLHGALFKEARKASSFRPVGNPYTFDMGSVHVTGHAGQPVDDLMRCTKLSPLEALTTCLEALHLAPTTPDTLETKPFKGEDPFIIDDFPHVLFSGGHESEAHEWRSSADGKVGTLCVCVPAFHRHPAIVLVNINDTRDVRVVDFSSAKMETQTEFVAVSTMSD